MAVDYGIKTDTSATPSFKKKLYLSREQCNIEIMKENFYDKQSFFERYGDMLRSKEGLKGAGEWPTLENIPDMEIELRRPMMLAVAAVKG